MYEADSICIDSLNTLFSVPGNGCNATLCPPWSYQGNNDGSSWANAWRDVDNINWSALQSEAVTQPVYLYFRKGVTDIQ
jgi:hypothetical protein